MTHLREAVGSTRRALPTGAATARRALRRPAARLLVETARRRPGMVGLALCYHRIGDRQGQAGHELVPALGTQAFAAQLRLLRASYRLVRAGELLEAASSRRPGERVPLAITFDDDLAVHAYLTAPLLRQAGVPATFFLGGATLEGPRPFWWQVLQRALDHGLSRRDPLLPRVEDPDAPGGVHWLADAVRALPPPEREALTAALLERIGGESPEPGLRADRVRSLADGFEIGFHTRDHESLDRLGDADLATALEAGRDLLEELSGGRLMSIAYPFGVADGRVADAARGAGFTSGFTLAVAPILPADDPLLLGRFQPDFAGAVPTVMALARATHRAL